MPAADIIAANAANNGQSAANVNVAIATPNAESPSPSSPASEGAEKDKVVAVDQSLYGTAVGTAQAALKTGSDAVWAATDRFAKLPFISRRILLVQNGVAAMAAVAQQAQAKAISLREISTARVAEVRVATTARVASIRDASQHLISTSLATSQSVIATGKDKIAHVRTDIVAIAEQSLASARVVLDQRVTPRATEAVHITRDRLAATVTLVQAQLDQLRTSLATVAADPRVAPYVERVTPVAVATRARVGAAVGAVTSTAKEWSTASVDFLKAHPIRGMPAEAMARARIVGANTQRRVHTLLKQASADPRYVLVADRVRPLAASLVELYRHTRAAAAAAAAAMHIGGSTTIPVATTTSSESSSTEESAPAASAPVTEEKNEVATPAASAPVEEVAPTATNEVVEEEAKAVVAEEEPVAAPAEVAAPSASPVTPQRRGAAAANASTSGGARKQKTSAKKGNRGAQ